MPYVHDVSTCLTCLHALRVCLPYVPECFCAFVSYVAYLSSFFLCTLRTFVMYVHYVHSFFTCLHFYRALCALIFFTCLMCLHLFTRLMCIHILHAFYVFIHTCLHFSYILLLVVDFRTTWHTFKLKLEKKRKMKKSILNKFPIFFQKIFFLFWEMKLSSPKLKNLIFLPKKNFSYISGENVQIPKNTNLLSFGKWNFLVPSLKSFSYISGENFPSSKIKNFLIFFQEKFLYFGKWNFLAPGLKSSSYSSSFFKKKKKLHIWFSSSKFFHPNKFL